MKKVYTVIFLLAMAGIFSIFILYRLNMKSGRVMGGSLPGSSTSSGTSSVGSNDNKTARHSKPNNRKLKTWQEKARDDLGKISENPELAEKLINSWNIPDYSLLSAEEKEQMIRLCSDLGQTNTISAKIRYEFIQQHIPVGILDKVIDDMIRLLPKSQIEEFVTEMKSMSSGKTKTELYKLVLLRMIAVGHSKNEILDWINSLDYDDERKALLQHLPAQ